MDIPTRRSNYSLLSQFPEEQQQSKFSGGGSVAIAAQSQVQTQFHESLSAEKIKGKNFDWDADHRLQQGGRIGNLIPSSGLQRHSSGSSFGESSLSGDYYVPTLSMVASDPEVYGHLQEDGLGSSTSKSWAQQTEESYQLQLALALRLSSEATCADDSNFLDSVRDDSVNRSSSASAEVMSHRFWVNGCLSYFDKVPDGFYQINGMDPYIWTVCTDLQENGRVPSIESLKAIDPTVDSSIEVVLIDMHSDLSLKELQNRVISLFNSCISKEDVVDKLAKLICNHMGGAASSGEDGLAPVWKDCSQVLKDCLGSVVIPLGSLSVGLCRHRALLFKVLADTIDLPCRIAKGCRYCRRDDASSCLVGFGLDRESYLDREYVVDLIEKPGCLFEPDSLLNGPFSISISSPLRLPKFKTVETSESFSSLAKLYFMDCQSLNFIFSDAPSVGGTTFDQEDATDPLFSKHADRKHANASNLLPILGDDDEIYVSPLPQRVPQPNAHNRDSQPHGSSNLSWDVISSIHLPKDPTPPKRIPSDWHRNVQPIFASFNPRTNMGRDPRFIEGGQLESIKSSTELSFDVEDLDIPWGDLVLKEKIGAGIQLLFEEHKQLQLASIVNFFLLSVHSCYPDSINIYI